MQLNNITNTDMIIYHNQNLITTCKAERLGFMGVYLHDIDLAYPVGTSLDIEFIIHNVDYVESKSVSMIVNHTDNDGTGLILKSFDDDEINNWQNILQHITTSSRPH